MPDPSLTLAVARAALDAGEFSALELTDYFLARIAQYDPTPNTFIRVTPELAREQAKRADAVRAGHAPRGALNGIPLALKDLFDLRGVPTTAGSKIFHDNIPDRDAEVTTRLRAAHAVILGKNNMHEFAFGVTNENPHYGSVRNPWNIEHVPGGSSGGGGAAVAARLLLGALGSDTGGSIRIPAALCGVTGLKPTYGRVSLRGVIPLSWSNDHAGPLAQTAEDCALLLNAIAGYDPHDPVSVNVSTEDFTAQLASPVKGLRFSMPRGFFETEVDSQILEAVEQAARVLVALGAVRVEKQLPAAQAMFQANRLTLRVEAATYHRARLEELSGEIGTDVLTRLKSFQQIRADDYALARRRQAELRRELELYFSDVDFLVTPTTPISAPLIHGDAVNLAQLLTSFTGPFDVTGAPALSVPCGFTSTGLPIGLQIIGPLWHEARVLQVGHQYQSATDWHARIPPLIAHST
jgi:aspartyl-tRNA(Asn)/glutamyl-tRNA(Gln) amidotransferase subunit A